MVIMNEENRKSDLKEKLPLIWNGYVKGKIKDY